ncbi:hypothetical protein MBANPS3_007673 [Mucor bainieri]
MSEFEGSKIYYFKNVGNNPILGRGDPLRLFFNDAGISFEYIRVTFAEWPEMKQKLIQDGHRLPTLPYLLTKSGKFYGTTAPLLRYISKKLNKYIPKDPEEEYLADAYADLYLDWMSKWVEAFLSKESNAMSNYENEYCASQHANWNNILGDKKGPFIFGDEISYTDFLLYHQLNNDFGAKVNAEKYPRIAEFVKAIQNRSSLQKHFEVEKREFNEIQNEKNQ